MKKLHSANKIQEILMITPMTIGFLLFSVYPIIWVLRWSFFKYNGYSEPVFVGLGNFRVVFFLPSVFSIAVVGLIFSILFGAYNGIVNAILKNIGLITQNISWFSDKGHAMFVIILVSLWTTFGLNMIYFLMGLQNISKSLYECASIDGANEVQQFFYITMPLVAPILQLVLMLSVLGTMKMTDLILVLTNGAPGGSTEVVMTYIFKYFFSYGEKWKNRRRYENSQ